MIRVWSPEALASNEKLRGNPDQRKSSSGEQGKVTTQPGGTHGKEYMNPQDF